MLQNAEPSVKALDHIKSALPFPHWQLQAVFGTFTTQSCKNAALSLSVSVCMEQRTLLKCYIGGVWIAQNWGVL